MPADSTAPAPESNPTPPPDLQVVPAPAAGKRHPGKLNKKQLAEIGKAEALIPLCRKPDASGALAVREITAAFLTALELRIAQARGQSTTAVNCSVEAKAATVDEGSAARELVQSLRTFQTAARLKYQQSDPVQLERYLIGERIDQSRPMLEQSGQTIINNTNQDRPPSIDTSMITAATDKLTAYTNADTPQTDERAAAKAARAARNTLVREIIKDRQKIQTAADSAWPYTNPANAGMRLKFRLPADRPYVP
jgi:hypothetical protein